MRFQWDDGNLSHATRHGVSVAEIEEAAQDPGRSPTKAYAYRGEMRQGVVGATKANRIVTIIYTIRGGEFRAISAHPATQQERRMYGA